jgi:hypothetical protein
MKYSSEVLIYVQKVKAFFTNDISARDYYYIDTNEEKFYELISITAQKNFDKNGDPMLNIEQFEEIRQLIVNLNNGELIDKSFLIDTPKNIFVEFNGYEKICLN